LGKNEKKIVACDTIANSGPHWGTRKRGAVSVHTDKNRDACLLYESGTGVEKSCSVCQGKKKTHTSGPCLPASLPPANLSYLNLKFSHIWNFYYLEAKCFSPLSTGAECAFAKVTWERGAWRGGKSGRAYR